MLTTFGNHLLFDFDTWCYDVAFAAQQKDGSVLPFSYCTDLIDTRFNEIMIKLDGATYDGYLTGKDNFRYKVATLKPYKGNRTQPKPHWYQAIRDYLVAKYNAQIIDGMEADDAISIAATSNPNAIIVSRDKDLEQVPARLFKYACGKQHQEYRGGVGSFNTINSAFRFFHQVLTGDTTDNYPGLPGIGDKKADVILVTGSLTIQGMLAGVQLAYADVYGDEWPERFLEQATLAWMVRELDQDGKPVLPKLNGEFYERYYRERR